MVEEMDALDKNDAWDIVEFPFGTKPIVENGCLRRSSMQKIRWRSAKIT